jgi:hypothetical protein
MFFNHYWRIGALILALALVAACSDQEVHPADLASTAAPSPAYTAEATGTPYAANAVGLPDGNPNFPDFPHGQFAAQIPHDVDNIFLLHNQDSEVRQRLFDILSWQTFIALNWPIDEQAAPQANFTDPGAPAWTTWQASTTLLRQAGLDPGPWDSASAGPDDPCPANRGKLRNLDVSSTDRANLLDTVTQPDAKKLWDQNGNLVYYEILLNQPEYNYLRTEDLYSLDGQASFVQNQETLYLPTGKYWDNSGQQKSTDPAEAGVIELKLAWKIIDPAQDIAERFYTETVCLLNQAGHWQQAQVGLVGLHIAHRTFSAAKWLWATFEQVDNTGVDPADVQRYAQEGRTLKPSFYDPACQSCQPNTISVHNGISKTQVVPVVASLPTLAPLNQQVQQRLQAAGSVWQYYRLVGTQWPPDPGSDGPPQPIPATLTNPVMETYIPAAQASCMNCHAFAAMAAQIERQPDGNEQISWAPAGSADFSFLLMKAQTQALVCQVDGKAAPPVIASLPTNDSPSLLGTTDPLRQALQACQVTLSSQASITKSLARLNTWQISDSAQGYVVREVQGALAIYRNE